MGLFPEWKAVVDHGMAFPYAQNRVDEEGRPLAFATSQGLSSTALLAGLIAGHMTKEGATMRVIASQAVDLAEMILEEEERRRVEREARGSLRVD